MSKSSHTLDARGGKPPASTTATGEMKNIGAYNHGTTNKDSKMR
jgi:hypothetical protein